MFRSIPVSNKICFDKSVKRSWKIHEDKIIRLKSSLSKERPETFEFLHQRPKKQALQEIRNIEIDRENKMLLQKIKLIQFKGCKNSYSRLYHNLSQNKKKTLNEPYRKMELLKIVEENQQILKRLQYKKSEYNSKKMEKERKEIERNISLISEFPYKDYPVSHTPVNFWATTSDFCPLKSSKVQASNLSFKGVREIDGVKYKIFTYSTKGSFYIEIERQQLELEKYRIEIPEDKVLDLLSISYNNQIEHLIDSLQLDKQKGVCFLKYQSNLKTE